MLINRLKILLEELNIEIDHIEGIKNTDDDYFLRALHITD